MPLLLIGQPPSSRFFVPHQYVGHSGARHPFHRPSSAYPSSCSGDTSAEVVRSGSLHPRGDHIRLTSGNARGLRAALVGEERPQRRQQKLIQVTHEVRMSRALRSSTRSVCAPSGHVTGQVTSASIPVSGSRSRATASGSRVNHGFTIRSAIPTGGGCPGREAQGDQA